MNDMNNENEEIIKITLEWEYKPVEYSNESFSLTDPKSGIEIKMGFGRPVPLMDSGRAVAEVFPNSLPKDKSWNSIDKFLNHLSKDLANTIKSYLYSVGLDMGSSISFHERPTRYFELDSGKTTVDIGKISCGLGHLEVSFNPTLEAPKKHIKESKEKQKELAVLIRNHLDESILKDLLQKYEDICNNPKSVLIHLYEIREILERGFNHIKKDRKKHILQQLNIEKEKWSSLGKICNNPSINQSRHTGQSPSEKQRDITPEELDEVKEIAKYFIKAYIKYLAKSTPNKSS